MVNTTIITQERTARQVVSSIFLRTKDRLSSVIHPSVSRLCCAVQGRCDKELVTVGAVRRPLKRNTTR